MPTASAQRHPSGLVGITKYPISAARIQPTAQKDSSATTTRPRIALGANSLTSVDATGSSAPSPTPTRKRSAISAATDPASADAPVASPYTSRVRAKTLRRPMRSASRPPTEAPIAMPTKPMDPMNESVVGVSCHWRARAAMTNEMRPTSMASRAQPTPEPTSNFEWRRVNGRRSSRSARVRVCDMAAGYPRRPRAAAASRCPRCGTPRLTGSGRSKGCPLHIPHGVYFLLKHPDL